MISKWRYAQAVTRILYSGMAKAFNPWASHARQQVKARHSASVASNFEALQKLEARIDDADKDRTEMKNVRKDLFKIFNPQGPVFNAGVSLTSGNVPGVSDTEDD